ncbi:sigma-70 family RNA polymerase sigma factor [Proteiniclasticum sp.]|uniref:sigma-70 family RNA polymerase sigma factor n=1 Tax=Proteiniclasticum sp. TaxID=2053595 RepID=UPI002898F387|nr:sigma-70 family RNA polymerase sigma factor [Proteiniclasticum sp.]
MLSDQDLMKLFQVNPEKALDRTMDLYAGLVYYIASEKLKGLCSKEDIEECVIDVFHEVYRQRNRIDLAKGSFKALIAVIAKRKAISIYRSQQSKARLTSSWDDVSGVPLYEDHDTEQIVVDKEHQSEIICVIRSLGEPDSEIFIRRYYFGQSTKSIAADLGLKENTVDKKVSRGHLKLRELLGGV